MLIAAFFLYILYTYLRQCTPRHFSGDESYHQASSPNRDAQSEEFDTWMTEVRSLTAKARADATGDRGRQGRVEDGREEARKVKESGSAARSVL